MLKYQEFPILRLEAYNKEGTLVSKIFHLKSHQPYYQSTSFSLINVIDYQTSQHMTLKKIFKTTNLSKQLTLSQLENQSKMKGNQNFIQIKQIYEDNENIYLLMQQNNENLQQILNTRKVLFEKQVQYIYCQLVSILQYLRSKNIFHGGICLNNLYFDTKTKKIKLSGFNNSLNISLLKQNSIQHVNLFNSSQPHPYIAPELLDNAVQNAYTYYAADIWSVGVVLYTLLIGQQPFTNYNKQNNLRTQSIIKLKNCVYEFPKISFNINNEINSTQIISSIWKQLFKKIFIPINMRIQLIDLIKHPLNLIMQSKFVQLNVKHVSRIKNHYVSEDYGILDGVKFDLNTNPHKIQKNSIKQANDEKTDLPPKPMLTGGEINNLILHIMISQQKNQLKLPLICQPPSYIQKYCYVKHNNSFGYIFQNFIGVIFNDGSCVVGQNIQEYTYISNDCINLDELLKLYIGVYDEYYHTKHCYKENFKLLEKENSKKKQKREVRQSNVKKQNHCKNVNSNRFTNLYNPKNGRNLSINLNLSNINVINSVTPDIPNTNIPNNSTNNLNISLSNLNKMLNTGIKNINGGLKKNTSNIKIGNKIKMFGITSVSPSSSSLSSSLLNGKFPSPSTPNTHNSIHFQNIQQIPQSMFSQQYFSYKYSQLLNSNSLNSLPKDKENIYQFFLQFFGDRVINCQIQVWVVAFWKLNCGFVFLYSDGSWQVNLLQGCDESIQKSWTDCNDTKFKNQQFYNLKRGKQSAVIIDKYGMAWWLKPDKASNSSNTNIKKESNKKLLIDYTNIQINRCNCINKYNNINNENKIKQQIINKYKQNFNYNYLTIKICRNIINKIKKLFIQEFQHIMEPYQFNCK